MAIDAEWKQPSFDVRHTAECPHCRNTAPQVLNLTCVLEIEDEDEEINPKRLYFFFSCTTCHDLLLYQADFPPGEFYSLVPPPIIQTLEH